CSDAGAVAWGRLREKTGRSFGELVRAAKIGPNGSALRIGDEHDWNHPDGVIDDSLRGEEVQRISTRILARTHGVDPGLPFQPIVARPNREHRFRAHDIADVRTY